MISGEFTTWIPNHVTLCDPCKNRFEVVIKIKKGLLYFMEGWKEIGNFYNLNHGGWIHIGYGNETNFYIRVTDKNHNEVVYPYKPSNVSFIPHPPACFHHALCKQLSALDVSHLVS